METENLTELSKEFYEKLFTRFPEWKQYAELSDSGHLEGWWNYVFIPDGKKRLSVTVPSPVNENHYIFIQEREVWIEIYYSNDILQMSAEEITYPVEESIEFIEKILEEKVVVGQERSFWGLGRKLNPLFFLTPAESQHKKFVNVYSWKGTFNRVNFLP